jgi:hypothetical protein
LIHLAAAQCREKGQPKAGLAESSTWRRWAQFSHKVIHRNGAQWEKSRHIKDLGSFLEVETANGTQVKQTWWAKAWRRS